MKTIREKSEKKIRNTCGMTMVELLAVVAIIAVLAGVAFISVASHMRSLGQLERDGIAKEIFVAAQNHLTMAYGENYLSVNTSDVEKPYGKPETDNPEVYYFVVNQGSGAEAGSLLDQMLPFGSIDETVRAGGDYVIRYQPSTGNVLDVFYCSAAGSRYGHRFFDGDSYDGSDGILDKRGADKKSQRRTYVKGSILGWYGGTAPSELAAIELAPPVISVTNADKLYVDITDANSGDSVRGKYSIKLILTGEISGAQKGIVVRRSEHSSESVDATRMLEVGTSYRVILDDISSNKLHFAQLGSDNGTPFIPGEDVRIQAVAYSTEYFANVAYSAEKTENSLFAGIKDAKAETDGNRVPETAYISSIRHLENLDKAVSNLDGNDTVTSPASYPNGRLNITDAVQTKDLSWEAFKSGTGGGESTKIYYYSGGGSGYNPTASTSNASYYPVSPDYGLSYDGKNHSITGIYVTGMDRAGLFGGPKGSNGKISASNIELIDFSITGTQSAGALAGELSGSSSEVLVCNVLARSSTGAEAHKITTTGTSGNAGGLVGYMNGGAAAYSAAALFVEGGSAGGLIGKLEGNTSVYGCYAGGHVAEITDAGKVIGVKYSETSFDVTGSSMAGGLIGNAGSSAITDSYSTCSVSGGTGGTAGGFVGSAGGTITNCYCTGRVTPDKSGETLLANAFFGAGSPTISQSSFFETVNEVVTDNSGTVTAINYKEPGNSSVTAIDASVASYNSFVGPETGWKPASAYSAVLRSYYGGRYNLKTVEQLEGGTSWDTDTAHPEKKDYFVRTHYGDWPAPEIFVINEAQ